MIKFIKGFSHQNIDRKQFYRSVFALVIPIALQNLINVGVTAADVLMLGKVGEKVLSGASLAGQVQFIMTLLFAGITSGATVLTAQYWGKKDTRTIEKILGIGLGIGMATALVFSMAALLIPDTLMRIYTSDPEVIAEGVQYLRIVGISYLFVAVAQV
jgi:Na+-driven multidrug efflux pump